MKSLFCSACEKPVSFLNFAKAPTPFHLKCDHCNTKLRFHQHTGFLLGLAIFFALLLAGAILALSYAIEIGTAGKLIALVAAMVLLEVIIYLIAVAMGLQLVPRRSETGERDER